MTEERSNGAFRRPVTLLRPHLPVNRLDNLEFQIRRIRSPPLAHIPRCPRGSRLGCENGSAHADACAVRLKPANLESDPACSYRPGPSSLYARAPVGGLAPTFQMLSIRLTAARFNSGLK